MTSHTSFVRARVDLELKKHVEHIFSKLGISAGNAINAFYRQVEIHNGIPFELKLDDSKLETRLEKDDKKEEYIKVQDEKHLKSLIGTE